MNWWTINYETLELRVHDVIDSVTAILTTALPDYASVIEEVAENVKKVIDGTIETVVINDLLTVGELVNAVTDLLDAFNVQLPAVVKAVFDEVLVHYEKVLVTEVDKATQELIVDDVIASLFNIIESANVLESEKLANIENLAKLVFAGRIKEMGLDDALTTDALAAAIKTVVNDYLDNGNLPLV